MLNTAAPEPDGMSSIYLDRLYQMPPHNRGRKMILRPTTDVNSERTTSFES